MKSIRLNGFGGADQLTFGEVDRPRPAAGQILIKVAATSVNRPDILQREGNYPPPAGESDILGLEAVGTVAEVGEGVVRWEKGARVMALLAGGGYTEYATAYADHAMPVPDNLDDQHAACVCETYLTAYLNLFLIAGLGDAQTVLVHGGGGGIGTAAIQLCRCLAPQCKIIATASREKCARVAQLGANEVIDYQNESFAARVLTITADNTHGGADVILDHLGAPYLQPNLKCLARGGTLMLIGVMGGNRAEFNLAHVMVKRQRIIGSVLRSRPIDEKAAIIAKFEKAVLPHLASGKIRPIISAVYPLAQAADAHRAMEAGGHFGKIVLTV